MKNRSDTTKIRHLNELLSGVGAATLGLGLGSRFSSSIHAIEVPLIIGGMISHAIGMYVVRHIDSKNENLPQWTSIVYWLCWVLLIFLAIYFVINKY